MKKLIKVIAVLGKFIEDFFIFWGLTLIVVATFKLNSIAGIYILGFICLIFGLLLTRKTSRR